MKKIVVLTGAGVSAESGLKTFRDSGGLWEGHDVADVASPEGWERNPGLVLDFYNERRRQALEAKPNSAHLEIAKWENMYEVNVITQNVDLLHEQAHSSKVLHLHGQLFKSRSTRDSKLTYDIDGWELNLGDFCEKGFQLRPDIVWFGEMVPAMEEAIEIAKRADVFIVIGTSLLVYPAAGLVNYVKPEVPIYVVDPKAPEVVFSSNVTFIKEPATIGVKEVTKILRTLY